MMTQMKILKSMTTKMMNRQKKITPHLEILLVVNGNPAHQFNGEVELVNGNGTFHLQVLLVVPQLNTNNLQQIHIFDIRW